MQPKSPLWQSLPGQLADLLPKGDSALRRDFETQAKALLQKVLRNMDLVTREEFDVQTKVLQRTRQKLEQLEQQVAALEQQQQQK